MAAPMLECRPGCGACCIAPSISSPIPGLPQGKAAGERCLQLTADNRCRLFGMPSRPTVCRDLRPSRDMCGQSAAEALAYLEGLERATTPAGPSLL
ncbi:MAG: YkgJ family cysteine cluster protein [Chloroflexota bacterium]